MSEVVTILIDQIDASDRLRGTSAEHVAGFAATLEKNAAEGIGYDGLCDPIKVRPLAEIGDDGIGYILISGMHRLEACKLLGRDSIAAMEYDIGAIGARRLEIEENLVRHDLNPLDKAVFVSEFREMFEAEYGEVMRGGDQSNNVLLWSEAAQERFGIGKMASSRHLRIANGLTPESIRALSGTAWASNQKALLELCAIEPERQGSIIMRLLDPDNGFDTVRQAIMGKAGPTELDTEERWFRKSLGLFGEDKPRRRRLWSTAFVRDLDTMREAAEASGFRIEPILGKDGS